MVAQVLDKLINACCGDNNPIANKLPFLKTNNDEKHDVVEKPSNGVKPIPQKMAPKKNENFTPKEMKFEMTFWKDLPLNARKAAKEIGYDQTKWDNSEHVHVEHKHWRDLTEDEKKAVETLGWEEEAWEHQYEHTEWSELPELQKKAALAAGFTDETWKHHWPEHLDKHWDDLPDDDKKALAVFGWCKSEWD